jgi:(p)ppGpp synthase/HD superfamily hydrolase
MVSVVHSLTSADTARTTLELLVDGLGDAEAATLRAAHDWVEPLYAGRCLGTGEPMHEHVVGQALICASLRLDVETRLAALLFPLHEVQEDAEAAIAAKYGQSVCELVARETLALYSPLANRLGVWELKWELEDLSFRFLHPAIYKEIATARREADRARAVHRRSNRPPAG